MMAGLGKLIDDYQSAVAAAVALLESSGIARPSNPTAWVELDIPRSGELPGKVRYFKHGFGCAVHLPSAKVDFDFGAQGQIDGFDIGRLVGFAGDRLTAYGFSSSQDIKTAFEAAAQSGEIVASEYILYYLAGADA
jgi:hypothetical protein